MSACAFFCLSNGLAEIMVLGWVEITVSRALWLTPRARWKEEFIRKSSRRCSACCSFLEWQCVVCVCGKQWTFGTRGRREGEGATVKRLEGGGLKKREGEKETGVRKLHSLPTHSTFYVLSSVVFGSQRPLPAALFPAVDLGKRPGDLESPFASVSRSLTVEDRGNQPL